jgi:hypothetical protein
MAVAVPAIGVGTLGATLTYVPTTATPGVESTHTLQFKTAGRVQAGGQITIQFRYGQGWDMPDSPTVAFVAVSPSVTVAGGVWVAEMRTLTVTTDGASIASAQQVAMTIAGAWSPADAQPASMVTVRTLSTDSKAIDESRSVPIAAIIAGTVTAVSQPSYSPAVVTPGVVSTHTLQFVTSGRIAPGGSITVQLPPNEGWDMPASPTVVFARPSTLTGPSFVASWNRAQRTLRITLVTNPTFAATIAPSQLVELTIGDARTPPSEQRSRSQITVETLTGTGFVIDVSAADFVAAQVLWPAPALGGVSTTPLRYVESAGAVPVSPDITVVDPGCSGAAASSATVTLTSPDLMADGLSYVPTTDSAGVQQDSYTADMGQLVLSGAVGCGVWQAALRAVAFSSSSHAPVNGSRGASFSFLDGSAVPSRAALPSNIVVRAIQVTAVNDAPLLEGIETAPLALIEGGAAAVASATITLVDPDYKRWSLAAALEAQPPSATVALQSADLASEWLAYDAAAVAAATGVAKDSASVPIGSYDRASGLLLLSGTLNATTIAGWQAALRAVSFNSSSQDPVFGNRTVRFAFHDGLVGSNVVARAVTIGAVNDAPTLAMSPLEMEPLVFTNKDSSPLPIWSLLGITEVDVRTDTRLASAVVRITRGEADDVLSYTPQLGISGAYDAAQGELLLAGEAVVGLYEQALRSLTFFTDLSTSRVLETARIISVKVSDGDVWSAPVSCACHVCTPDVLCAGISHHQDHVRFRAAGAACVCLFHRHGDRSGHSFQYAH